MLHEKRIKPIKNLYKPRPLKMVISPKQIAEQRQE